MAAESTILFRARVPAARLRKAEKVLNRLGMKTGDALNLLLAQIEIRGALPFEVTTRPPTLLSAEEQADEWNQALGAY
jgi:antitoxin component of RelBE/YafQ-DinJ toxin-antitoxin module